MNKRSIIAIGFMLFALFFGAGNLIFPAELGQAAGTNIWTAGLGFLITGVGLPLLGILALAISDSSDLQVLASRVHPVYGLFFTALLYLTIGPFFAAPRTGTVAFEVGIEPFVAEGHEGIGLFVFSLIFFALVLVFSLYPARMVDNIGKILSPVLVVLLGVLLVTVLVSPMGAIQNPLEEYDTFVHSSINGFLEGYNTMDALASLVFGIIVIQAVRSLGVKSSKEVFSYTLKSGIIAVVLLGAIYIGITYLGATSVAELGIVDNGGSVLNEAAVYYFGTYGGILLAIVIILACLTTAIGLTSASAEYFHSLIPVISIKWWVVIFAVITFVIANFGLSNIITFSLPVLMFLYPLAIALVLLTFAGPLFNNARMVYVATIGVTFLIAIVDGFKALCESLEIDYFNWLQPVINIYEQYLPLYNDGLGWLLPAVVVCVVATIVHHMTKAGSAEA